MKHFLKAIWSFVRKLPKQVTALIKPTQQIIAAPQLQNEKKNNCKLPKRKIKKRLKTFKSFLREEEQAIQRSRRKHERLERKRRFNRMIRSSLINSSSVQNPQPLEEEQSKESFTNEIELAGPVIFQDGDGLEISVILPEANSPEKTQQGAAESDEELLQLICGDKEEESEKNKLLQIPEKRVFDRRKNYQYSQQTCRKPSNMKEKPKTIKYSFNPQDDSLLSQQNSNLPSGEKKKFKYKKDLKQEKNRIKVINLVDLVSNQDNPPIYQIPLFVEQRR